MTNNTGKISNDVVNPSRIRKIPKKADEIHTLEDILDDLHYLTMGFPDAAMASALNKQAEITPILLNLLDETLENYESIDDSYFGHLHALFLLAKFREKRAFPRVIKIISLLNDWSETLLGDVITEGLHNILASLYDGDIAALYAIIENPGLNTWSRNAALKTLLVLVKEKVLTRSEVILYFKMLFNHPAFKDDLMATTNLVRVCCDLYPDELQDVIQVAFDRGMVDDFSVNREDVKSILSTPQDTALSRFSTNKYYGLIDDVTSMKHWFCFREEFEKKPVSAFESSKPEKTAYHPMQRPPYFRSSPKIGRNDPCPCGSGKKYKKCCILN